MPNYKVVDADVLDADLQTVADAIKAKAGTEEALAFPSGFASAVESIETGGGADHTIEDGLITGTLTEYTNDRVESVKVYAFYYSEIASISLPNAKEIKGRAFQYAKATTVILPNVETIGEYAFSYAKLTEIRVPICTSLGSGAFQGCSSLELADMGMIPEISGNFNFKSCSKLTTLILRNNGVTALRSTSHLDSTPYAIGKTGGTVYVPAALIEIYQTATNWSALYEAGTCNFVAIEGSEYE